MLLAGGLALVAAGRSEPRRTRRLSKCVARRLRGTGAGPGPATRSAALTDGRGADRVWLWRCCSAPALALRPATEDDCLRLPSLAQPSASSSSPSLHDPTPIPLDDFTAAGFQRTLADPDRRLLIAESAGTPVGVVRFDIDGDAAKISAPPSGSPVRPSSRCS